MKKLTATDLKHEVKAYALITLGLLIYTFAVTAFLAPNHLVGGGVTGISTIIYFLSGETIPIGYSYFVLNFILIAIAVKVLGPRFGLKTVYAIFMSSLLLSVFQNFIHEPLLTDKFMCAVLSGIMCGAGIGISLANGGSTAGTDIVAMMINKYHNISPGKIIMYLDVVQLLYRRILGRRPHRQNCHHHLRLCPHGRELLRCGPRIHRTDAICTILHFLP